MASNPRTNRGPGAGPANREALIAAAREVFADAGYLAPLSAVARRAGVGQGSLYRHFPDRVALAVAAFDESIEDLEALAARTDSTLTDLFDRIAEQAIGSTALIDLILANLTDERTTHLGTRIMAVIDELLSRDQRAGRIGAHVDAADVMLAVTMLATLLTRTAAVDRAVVAEQARAIFRRAFAA